MTRHIVLFGLMTLAACATDTRKEERTTERPTEQTRAPAEMQVDEDFIQRAASGGMFEVESGRLALSRQTDDQTTELAQHLIRDHSQANDKLEQLAQEKAMEVPDRMMPEDEQKLEQLRSAQGEEFTSMFEQIQAQAHRETIALFERCAQYCQDMDVREYASSTLPTLRDHMREIEQLQPTAQRPEEPEALEVPQPEF